MGPGAGAEEDGCPMCPALSPAPQPQAWPRGAQGSSWLPRGAPLAHEAPWFMSPLVLHTRGDRCPRGSSWTPFLLAGDG